LPVKVKVFVLFTGYLLVKSAVNCWYFGVKLAKTAQKAGYFNGLFQAVLLRYSLGILLKIWKYRVLERFIGRVEMGGRVVE